MKITFETENKKLLAQLEDISARVTPAAQATALNQSAAAVARESVKIAARKTGVSQPLLRRRIMKPKRWSATARYPYVYVWGGTWPIRVSKLTPKPKKLKSGPVKYKAIRGDKVRSDAFIAPHRGGRDEVFVRKGRGRLPIQVVTADIGPAVRSAIGGYIGSGAARRTYQERFFKQMDRRVRNSLRRYGMEIS